MALVILYGSIKLGIATGKLNAYYQLNLFLIGINIILAVSLNLINGFTGQFPSGMPALWR